MIYKYRGIKIHYRFFNRQKNVTNIFLHGWGLSMQSLLFCDEYLQNENSLFIDFPPFGKSCEIPKSWSIFTYANMVVSLCEFLQIEKFNLIGHSFGGRVAILVATLCRQKTKKLVLVDSAGIKPKRGVRYHLKVLAYKIRKKLHLNLKDYGSEDYKKLSPEMKGIFVSIVNTHLDSFLPMIEAKTLIVFGKQDKTTPIYMAKTLHKRIKDSQLYIMKNAGHFCFMEKKISFVSAIEKFLK